MRKVKVQEGLRQWSLWEGVLEGREQARFIIGAEIIGKQIELEAKF